MFVHHLPENLPPAIPDADTSFREVRFYEILDKEASDIFSRRVVCHFRRFSKYDLDGQVKFDV